MRKLIYGMNLTLDGYVAAPGDDLSRSRPSDELFQWWLDQELAIGLLLYGRKWETMTRIHVDAQFAHVWQLHSGKVVRFQQYTDTKQWVEAAGTVTKKDQ